MALRMFWIILAILYLQALEVYVGDSELFSMTSPSCEFLARFFCGVYNPISDKVDFLLAASSTCSSLQQVESKAQSHSKGGHDFSARDTKPVTERLSQLEAVKPIR